MKKIIILLAGCLAAAAFASQDAEATKVYDEAYKAYQDKNYYKAANLFEDARILAKSPTIKANCLRAQVGAWRMCEMPYREYKAIEALLTGYPEFANFKELVTREYEIGTAYYKGVREPSYWHLRWIPWLTGDNKCAEIYTQALKRAPFSPQAASARLRLAHFLDERGKSRESIEQLRTIVKDYPDSPEYRYALLALANGLFIQAERGDGDGRYVSEAHDILDLYRRKYPKSSEMEWVTRHLAVCKDIQARRYYDMACYYDRNGKQDAARRYLAIVLRDYPDSLAAPQAEKMLLTLDKTFTPGDFVPEPDARLPRLRAYQIPAEAPRVLITPGRGKNHYLVPVPDYSHGRDLTQETKK